jgi:hypothetical protein
MVASLMDCVKDEAVEIERSDMKRADSSIMWEKLGSYLPLEAYDSKWYRYEYEL